MNLRLSTTGSVLAFLSGFAALVHELLWTRRLVDLLGASSASTSRVFGCFFLGLALGAAFAARKTHGLKRPLLAVASAEVGVILFSLPILFLPQWTDWVWPWLGAERFLTIGPLVKTVLSMLVIVPPAFCMGLVLPFLLTGLEGNRNAGLGIRIYALNTLGAAVGILAAILWILPAFGMKGAMFFAMTLNALVALGAFVFSRSRTHSGEGRAFPSKERRKWPIPFSMLSLAFFSGAFILAGEILATRMFLLVATLSFHAPAAIMGAMILFLAIGAFAAPLFVRSTSGWNHRRRVSTVLLIAGCLIIVGPLLFMSISSRMNWGAENASIESFILKLFAVAIVSVGPGFLAGGIVFPLLIGHLKDQGYPEGRGIGWLLAANGIGGVLGAEAALHLVMPHFGVYTGFACIAGLYVLCGLLSIPHDRIPAYAKGALAILWLSVAIHSVTQLPVMNVHTGLTLLDHQAGPEGVVAVVEDPEGDRSIILSNQYVLGGTAGRWIQERQGHLPMLLHRAPREVAFIGLATGITPGAALAYSEVESITVIELSPLVAEAAGKYFGDYNGGVVDSPRVKLIVEDGRTFISSSPGRFDVVVGDLFLPWGPGEARLYTLEHFRAVRRSLRPDGVFCQWLALYQLTPEQLQVIADTFQAVFPDTHLFFNGLDGVHPMLALVGRKDDSGVNWDMIASRCRLLSKRNEVLDPLLRHKAGVAMLDLGRWQPKTDRDLNTLGNLRIELNAGKKRLTGSPGSLYFYGSRWLSFCRERWAAMEEQGESPQYARFRECASQWLTWDLIVRNDRDAAKRFERALWLPVEVKSDHNAGWDRWAGIPDSYRLAR